MKKIFVFFMILNAILVAPSYSMEEEKGSPKGTALKQIRVDSTYDDERNSVRLISLESGNPSEEYNVLQGPSNATIFKGTVAKYAAIGCSTLIGAGIGLAVISGELNPEIAYTLVKAGSPIIIGSTVGCMVGTGLGSLFKSRFTGKCS